MSDLSQTAASVVAVSLNSIPNVIRDGVFGETVTAGAPIYVDASDSDKIKKADANDTAPKAYVRGVALNGGSNNQPCKYIESGHFDPGATVTVGVVYCVSASAGGICPIADLTAGQYVSQVGLGVSASAIRLALLPSGVVVPA